MIPQASTNQGSGRLYVGPGLRIVTVTRYLVQQMLLGAEVTGKPRHAKLCTNDILRTVRLYMRYYLPRLDSDIWL